MNAVNTLLRCILVAAGVLTAGGAAWTASYIAPTPIPDAPSLQRDLVEQLSGEPAEQRTLVEWKQLAVLLVIRASEASVSDNASLDTAERTVQAATAKYPHEPELMALGGSVTAMRARDPALPGVMAMALVKQGFRQLDRAVAMNELDLGARLQRGICAVRTPPFLGKIQIGKEDLQFILDRQPDSREPAAVEFRAMLQYLMGEAETALGRTPQAAELYHRAAALNSEVWSARARARLND